MDTYESMKRLLMTEFGVRADRIAPEATFDAMGLDSLSTVELVLEIEREFGITVSVEEARFLTFGEAVATVDAMVGNGAA